MKGRQEAEGSGYKQTEKAGTAVSKKYGDAWRLRILQIISTRTLFVSICVLVCVRAYVGDVTFHHP